MGANADVTSRVVHAGPFTPLLRERVEASDRVEVLVAVKAADHVDEIVQGAESVIGSRCCVRAH